MAVARARRSILSVPATVPRFAEKAAESDADEVMLDLEDSVAPALKEAARTAAAEALRRHRYAGKVRGVRINDCESRWCYGDVISVVEQVGDLIDVLTVPKVEGEEHVHFVDVLLSQLEAGLGLERRIGLELQIESARGLARVERIAAASTRTEVIALGPGDFAASMGIPSLTVGGFIEGYPGDYWHHTMSRIAMAAKAHGLQVVDGPYAKVRDLDGLRESAGRAAMLGYDGKWALNPQQIEILNQVFAPSQADFDRATAILEAYARATEQGSGAVLLGDEMIDEATRKMAEQVASKGRMFGMRPSP